MNGVHLVANLEGCQFDFSQESLLMAQCQRFCTEAGFTVVGAQQHVFEPQGVTFAILLSESHMTLHTWPELGKVAMDLYTCNFTRDNTKATLEAFEKLKAVLKPSEVKGMLVERESLAVQSLSPTGWADLRIVCSAVELYDAQNVKQVQLVGIRHWDECMTVQYRGYLASNPNAARYAHDVQGFLTNEGQFVNRQRAFEIAMAAGQLRPNERISYKEGLPALYSENLY